MNNPQEIELDLYKQVFLMREGQSIEGKKNAVKELGDWLFFHTDNVGDFHTAYEMAKELITGSAPRTSSSIEELTGVIEKVISDDSEYTGAYSDFANFDDEIARDLCAEIIAKAVSNLLNGEGNDE